VALELIPVTDGTALPTLVAEPTAGTCRGTVLFAHGIFSEKSDFGRFERLAGKLNAIGLRTVRFDFRGHGEHALPLQQATIAGMLLDFTTMVEYVERTFGAPVFWIASSFGGSIALLYLQTPALPLPPAPHLPTKIVFVNPVVDYASTFVTPERPIFQEAFSAEKWAVLDERGFIEPLEGRRLNRTFANELRSLRPYAAFERLAVPALILHGTNDGRVSHDTTRDYAQRSPQVEFASLAGADHNFIEQWAEDVAFARVLAWFAAG
jgi:uncharacterized protein